MLGSEDGRGAVPVHVHLRDTKGLGPGPAPRAAAAAALVYAHEHHEVSGSGHGHPPLADATRLAGRASLGILLSCHVILSANTHALDPHVQVTLNAIPRRGMGKHPLYRRSSCAHSVRDASECIRRHQAVAPAPVFTVYRYTHSDSLHPAVPLTACSCRCRTVC